MMIHKKEESMNKKIRIICAMSTFTLAAFSFSAFAAGPITKEEVASAQQKWGECLVKIGQTSTNKGDVKAAAATCIDTLYAYDNGGVLFKPTKAAEVQFRPTKKDALSYFVTGDIKEDHGFALQPWSKVRFENASTITDSDSAISMGNYYFTDAKTGKEVKVEYTFGYTKDDKGNLRINLHHSSLPYTPAH
jgi:hypothetical protein